MKKLSFENIIVMDGYSNTDKKVRIGSKPFGAVALTDIESPFALGKDKLIFQCVSDNGEVLAEAQCITGTVLEHAKNTFYETILKNEVDYIFNELNDEEKKLTDSMPLEDFIKYALETLEDEASTLSFLWDLYLSLYNFGKENMFCSFAYINYIEAFNDNTGAGTLILKALKKHYSSIFLYSTSDSEDFWIEKGDFKEIIDLHLYWTDNNKLDLIFENNK